MKRYLLASAIAAAVAGCGGPQPPPFRIVADNKLLMQSVVEPAAEVIWDSVGTIVTAEKTEELRPSTEEEWTTIRNSAVALAESGNLLMMVPRARDSDAWMKAAQAMIDTSVAAMRAAEARNPDQLFTVGGQIYDTCTNCHQQYIPAIVNRVGP